MLSNLNILAGCLLISSSALHGAVGDSTTIPMALPQTSRETETNNSDPDIDMTDIDTEKCCKKYTDCAESSSQCHNCTCLCRDGYVMLTDLAHLFSSMDPNGTCLYLTGNHPDQNCTVQACGEKLVCKENKCTCPSSCKFRKSDFSCSCVWEIPEALGLVIAFVLTFLIFVFWYIFWKDRIQRYMARVTRVRRIDRNDRNPGEGISTIGAAYGTDHVMLGPLKPALYSSPFRNHQTIAPASQLPGYNAYGQNLDLAYRPAFNSAYHSSLLPSQTSLHDEHVTTSLPAYPDQYLSGSAAKLPYSSRTDEHSVDGSVQEKLVDRNLEALNQYAYPLTPSFKIHSSNPGCPSTLNELIEGARLNRSARF